MLLSPRGNEMIAGTQTTEAATHTQFAALPFRFRDGTSEVMLITSRGSGRWVIPKGWPSRRFPPAFAAAREAYEEAGLLGAMSKRPIGRYLYEKRLSKATPMRCEVEVFLLAVERELLEWPERQDRGRWWLPPLHAASCVAETGLQDLFFDLHLRLQTDDRRELGIAGKALIDVGSNGKPKVRARRCRRPSKT